MNKAEINEILAMHFKKLAAEKPIEKITIQEISDRAGVARPTFYRHFQDKFELMEWIIKTELLFPLKPLIEAGMMEAAMTLLFTNIQKEKSYYLRAAKLDGPVSFHQVAIKCVNEALYDLIKGKMSGKNSKHAWLTPEVVSAYYAQSMVFAFEEWINAGMIITPQEMSEAYRYMLTRSLEDVINGK